MIAFLNVGPNALISRDGMLVSSTSRTIEEDGRKSIDVWTNTRETALCHIDWSLIRYLRLGGYQALFRLVPITAQ